MRTVFQYLRPQAGRMAFQMFVKFIGTITELLVLPAYQRQGIGSRLLRLAAAHTPTLLYFGAQPGAEAFYEKNGCQRSLPSYLIEPKKDGAS